MQSQFNLFEFEKTRSSNNKNSISFVCFTLIHIQFDNNQLFENSKYFLNAEVITHIHI